MGQISTIIRRLNGSVLDEIQQHGSNGLLVDFFDSQALAQTVALARPGRYQKLRENARQTVAPRYDLDAICLRRYMQMIANLMG